MTGDKYKLLIGTHMTFVLLTRDDDEKTIEFPTEETFRALLKRVRQIEPDRRWQITESWDR